MTSYRVQRATSPAPRVYVDPTRASTGGLTTYTTSYDAYPRKSFVGPDADRGQTQSASRHNSVYEIKPTTRSSAVGGGTRTEYTVRPRTNSEVTKPASITTRNLSPTKPSYVESPREISYRQPRPEKNSFLEPVPPSARHTRHSSTSRVEPPVSNRYITASSSGRPQKEYHRRGPSVPYVQRIDEPLRSQSLRAQDDAYSYTTPREQFAMDYPVSRPQRRESVGRRERPMSTIESSFREVPFRREPQPSATSSRTSDRAERDSSRTHRSAYESDPDKSLNSHSRRRQSVHKPTVVHQRDEGYGSSKDDYSSRRRSIMDTRVSADEVIASDKAKYRDSNRYRDRDNESAEFEKVKPPRRDHAEARRERLDDRDYDRQPDYDRVRHREPPREKDWDRERDRENDRYKSKDQSRSERPIERRSERQRDEEVREKDRSWRDYDKARDDDDRRRKPRSRDPSPEHSDVKKIGAGAALGGAVAAAAGLARSRHDENVREQEERDHSHDEGERKHRRRRRSSRSRHEEKRHNDDDRDHQSDLGTDRGRPEGRHAEDSSGSDTPEERKPGRSRSRVRNRPEGRAEGEIVRDESRDRTLAIEGPSGSYPANPIESVRRRSADETSLDIARRAGSPREEGEEAPRTVQLVEPAKEVKAPLKGILKAPRATPFPEDPNPQREGVAPLNKKGVPAGAKWTKIRREAVNPEALKRLNERFEARDDYVVVLRVVPSNEIEKMIELTKQIRQEHEKSLEARLREREERRAERRKNDPNTDDEYDYSYDDEERREAPQLQIADTSYQPSSDLHHLTGESNGGSARSSGEALPVPVTNGHEHKEPEVNFDSYSQNV